MPLIPAPGRQRQLDLYEFEASLVYRESSRTAKAIHTEKSCLEKQTKATKQTKMVDEHPLRVMKGFIGR